MRDYLAPALGIATLLLLSSCRDFDRDGEALAIVHRLDRCEIIVTGHMDSVKPFRARILSPECAQ